jgi:hypothetical protein
VGGWQVRRGCSAVIYCAKCSFCSWRVDVVTDLPLPGELTASCSPLRYVNTRGIHSAEVRHGLSRFAGESVVTVVDIERVCAAVRRGSAVRVQTRNRPGPFVNGCTHFVDVHSRIAPDVCSSLGRSD